MLMTDCLIQVLVRHLLFVTGDRGKELQLDHLVVRAIAVTAWQVRVQFFFISVLPFLYIQNGI